MRSLPRARKVSKCTTEVLILPDGRILAHNTTPAMARILAELNPRDQTLRRRANAKKNFKA